MRRPSARTARRPTGPRPPARAACALAVVLAASLAACNSPSHPPAASSQGTPPPILTQPGVPTGAPSAGGIGSDGGTLTSADGRITLTVPPGAVSSQTQFSLEPITNTAIGGVGGAFRIRPEGVLQKPVTLLFKGPATYQSGTTIAGLGISYQDQSGFWFPVTPVQRDAGSNTLTVTTSHFSDWGVVWTAGVPGLYGPFTLTQTYAANVPFNASGNATLFYQGSNSTKTLYVLTGSIAETQISKPGATCDPVDVTTQTLSPSVAEQWTSPSQFRWSINAQWSLTCTDTSNVTTPDFMTAVFDTLGINLVSGCTRGYVDPPVITTTQEQGTYTIDCGADGAVTASWNFIACIPGQQCSDPSLNPCDVQVISCDTGAAVCTDTGTALADGTSCGTYLACAAGVCTCTAGATCAGADACHTGTVTCSGNTPTCAQTALPDGTSCGATQVCTAGACKTLSSIAVTPANPSVLAGGTQQFTATGTYSDASTQDLTGLVTWASSSTTAATIAAGGLATTIAAGPTTISATLNGVVGSTTLTVQPTLQSIAVTPVDPSVIAGGTLRFTATGTYSDASTQDLTASVTWASSNGAAATIDATGLATTVAAGTTTISASSGSVTGSTTLTVLPVTLTSIAVTPVNPSVVAGRTQQFTATGTYNDGSTQDLTATVTWGSTTPGVATIAAGGLATTATAGTTTISATSGAVSGSTILTVTPAELVSIVVTPASSTFAAGATPQFTATGTYTDGSTQSLTATATWASTDTSVATIAAGGLATTLAAGTTTISATSGSISGSTTLTVTAAALVSIAVTSADASVPAGLTEQFAATGTYTDGSTQSLTATATWASTDGAVATIAAGGLATSVAAGTTTISATFGSVTGSTTFVVTAPVLASIAVTPVNPTVNAGETQQFFATGTYTDRSTQDLTATATWASTDTGTATIAAGGLATSVAFGTTTISASADGVTGSTGLTVLTATLTSLAVTPADSSVPAGFTQQFTATGTYSDGSTQNLTGSVTWASTNPGAATIDATGLASTAAVGTTTISAIDTSGVISNSTTLIVTAPVLRSIAVTPVNPVVTARASQQFTATGTNSDGTTQNMTTSVSWLSSDTGIATIDPTGLATTLQAGSVQISASASGKTGSATLTAQ